MMSTINKAFLVKKIKNVGFPWKAEVFSGYFVIMLSILLPVIPLATVGYQPLECWLSEA